MSLANYIKNNTLKFFTDIYRQADPTINTNSGSAVRATTLVPMSLINSALFQEIDDLSQLYIGNYNNISESDMDLLGGLLVRPKGTRSLVTVRVYLDKIEPIRFETYPYFSNRNGYRYQPTTTLVFGIGDILTEDGENYVNVPCISLDYGSEPFSESGDITVFDNLPDIVTRVSNPIETQGGVDQASNQEYYEYIKKTFNDGTLNEIGGVKQYITDFLDRVTDSLVVPSGDPLMVRDELWSVDNVIPNLDREGYPFAEYRAVTIEPNNQYGRIYSPQGFTESDIGKRIFVENDIEKFRTITSVSDQNYAIVTGPYLEGSYNARIYEVGPKVNTAADVYMYTPAVEIFSAIIDKRFFLKSKQNNTSDKIYYETAPGYSYSSIPENGVIVINEGLTTEDSATVISQGNDQGGDFIVVDKQLTTTVDSNISLYDMSKILIGEDIQNTPVIYVLSIDTLDPLSFTKTGTIDRTEPGAYNPPGWYIGETDTSNVFSSREKKTIFIDPKTEENSYTQIDITNAKIASFNTIDANRSMAQTEGRVVDVTIPAIVCTNSQLIDFVPDNNGDTGRQFLESPLLDNITFIEQKNFLDSGKRNDLHMTCFRNGTIFTQAFKPSDFFLEDGKVTLYSGTFDDNVDRVWLYTPQLSLQDALDNGWLSYYDENKNFYFRETQASPFIQQTSRHPIFFEEQNFEDVIIDVDGNIITVSEDMVYESDTSGPLQTNNITISLEGSSNDILRSPVRVTYATNTTFGNFQTILDSGDNQLLCKDTLCRSFMPTLIDAVVDYSGESSPSEIYSRFVNLIGEISVPVNEGQDVRLDMSNIIAALDEEGLVDSINVNIPVRVTNYTSDGEYQVRYLNPSEAVKQELAVATPNSVGDENITLRRVDTVTPFSGRGKLFLGGKNPSTQESVPYEAIIDNGDDTFTFVIRDGYNLQFVHNEWESVFVTVRDYDPDLEYKEGAIYIPNSNRPYVRDLVIQK